MQRIEKAITWPCPYIVKSRGFLFFGKARNA